MTALSAEHITENALPIIDIAALRNGDAGAREAVGKEMRAACLDRGFMYVSGHGVDPDLQKQVLLEVLQLLQQVLFKENLSACNKQENI